MDINRLAVDTLLRQYDAARRAYHEAGTPVQAVRAQEAMDAIRASIACLGYTITTS